GAAAQTTVILSDPGTEVTGTTIQAGAGANTNFSALDSIATSTGTTPDDLRHALLKFDTQNTMPAGMHVVSATLSLTLKSGGSDGVTDGNASRAAVQHASWRLGHRRRLQSQPDRLVDRQSQPRCRLVERSRGRDQLEQRCGPDDPLSEPAPESDRPELVQGVLESRRVGHR